MTETASKHAVGSLVRVRGRDWVVAASEGEVYELRPLSGSAGEATTVHAGVEGEEGIVGAEFPAPAAAPSGDLLAGRLLREAARLALRDGAAPFRSLGRLSVRPRPYQFVPLILAMRMQPARLLIADDVGIGKTVEAGLIASELLARGEARRLLVLCPPHLCEQWEKELRVKFHLQAEVVRSGTVGRLERTTPAGRSLYEYHRHLIVSADFAKSERNRPGLLRDCPDLVIVDEAHTAARPGEAGGGQQLRYELVRAIAAEAGRHLLLLSATPHSGIEASFRSLLAMLDPAFDDYDLDGLTEGQRRRLAQHVVQRRRGDIDARLLGGEGRPFPERVPPFEATYRMSAEYGALFREVLAYTRRAVQGGEGEGRRARYWAALALLRCLMSSPAAAARALEARGGGGGEASDEEWEREALDDPMVEGGTSDVQPEIATSLGAGERAKLQELRRRAEALGRAGEDPKLAKSAEILEGWLKEGYRPIVFCRFVATAGYVAERLRERLGVRTAAVTGETGSEDEREAAIAGLVEGAGGRVLVATDCLSEGVNLQEHFDAVLHYDLPWNPNRLEQREGRVDRFGQGRATVRGVVLFSDDNPVDGIVLNVLLRKARAIYQSLGVSVPVPAGSESVMQAVMRAVFEGKGSGEERQLSLGLETESGVAALHENWERNADREKRRRSRFAQHAVGPEEVARELEKAEAVLGDPAAVRSFMENAAQRLGFGLRARDGHWVLEPERLPAEVRARTGWKKAVKVVFVDPPPKGLEDAEVLGRNHPIVAGLSGRVLGRAFAPRGPLDHARSGAGYTRAVERRTVVALLRVRYALTGARSRAGERRGQDVRFAEEVVCAARMGTGWALAEAELLHTAEAAANITPGEKAERLREALAEVEADGAELTRLAEERARELEATYARLRGVVRGGATLVRAWPPDVLGLYVLLPAGGGRA